MLALVFFLAEGLVGRFALGQVLELVLVRADCLGATSLVLALLWYLQAPIERVTGYDVPVPSFAREFDYLPDIDRIEAAARRVLDV